MCTAKKYKIFRPVSPPPPREKITHDASQGENRCVLPATSWLHYIRHIRYPPQPASRETSYVATHTALKSFKNYVGDEVMFGLNVAVSPRLKLKFPFMVFDFSEMSKKCDFACRVFDFGDKTSANCRSRT